MTAGVVIGGQFVARNYTTFPIQGLMRRCLVNHTVGGVNYYCDPSNSAYKINGDPAILTGADGQVMVEVPQFRYIICTDGDNKYFLIGRSPFSLTKSDLSVVSSAIHPWFLEGGVTSSYKYISAFEAVLKRSGAYVDGTGDQTGTSGDLIHSIYGYYPLTYFHRTERRAYSVDGVFHQYPFWADEAMLLLFLTEYKTWNSQAAIPGYTGASAWALTKRCKTGITASLGNASGSALWENAPSALRCTDDMTGYYIANSFRGIENFYGHLWKWVDGINLQYVGSPLTEASVYLCNTPANWADGTATNYTDMGIDLPLSSGYQRNLHDGCFLPNSVSGGSSTTYVTDYFYASSSAGWRALRSGGGLRYGAYAGGMDRHAANAASTQNAEIGGRVVA